MTIPGLSQVARRTALSLLSGASFLLFRAGKSEAAFGDAARVFGSKPTNTTGVLTLSLPCLRIVTGSALHHLSMSCSEAIPAIL